MSRPSWLRVQGIAAASALAFALLPVAVSAGRGETDVPVATILAAYTRATHSDDVTTYAAQGTLIGEGLTGTFTVVRDGTNEREDDVMGPRHETTLRLGDRIFVRNANGNVRELRGYLHRRGLTEDLLDSGAFATHPELARFAGWGDASGVRAWRLEVRAAGGEPMPEAGCRYGWSFSTAMGHRSSSTATGATSPAARFHFGRCSPTAIAATTRSSKRRR